MVQDVQFNPIQTAQTIENRYREYIASTIHFADADLQQQLEDILAKPRFLAKGPYLESAPPYEPASSLRVLVDQGLLCRGMLSLGGFDPDRPLYAHQERAIKKALEGRNYAVVTGTGSGKTECFLLPIINDILAEFESAGPSSGVRAMILYPMNALANDQLKRLRTLLAGTEITFGRYTGDTETTPEKAIAKWKDENLGQNKLPNEIISREEIRKNPPNILLTNYSMLEYLLLRPEDAPLFGSVFGARWRHIAIDEAHVYTGALGTEIAYLIRRLKARITSEVGVKPTLQCYATSATIGSEADMPAVARFAEGLFGEPFSADPANLDVITSKKNSPVDALDATPWGTLPFDAWTQLRSLVEEGGLDARSHIRDILADSVPVTALDCFDETASLPRALGSVLLGEVSTGALVRRMEDDLLDLTDTHAMSDIGIEGLDGKASDVETLSAMVEVLSWAQRADDVPILTSRYHSFLRAPEGLFINLRDRKLIEHKSTSEVSVEGYLVPVYETSVCRHCGQAYILGVEASCTENGAHSWLNPKHEGTDADDEFLPRDYYRIISLGEEPNPEETVQWLCPICGTLCCDETGGEHRFGHVDCARVAIAHNNRVTEDDAKCNHCGYQSPVAIQPMRVSPEAAGSVVCYDLVRDIPPFASVSTDKPKSRFRKARERREEKRGGNVICFSDRRQDAAFFAPAMERTYGNITKRQLIREAVEAKSTEGKGCTPTQACNWIASEGPKRYGGFMDVGAAGDQAEAWMLDELAAEDSRNSLEGLGVVRMEPVKFNGELDSEDIEEIIGDFISELKSNCPWVTVEDYKVFLKVCLETLRERSAIDVPVGVDIYRENHNTRTNDVVFDKGSQKGDILFVGVTDNKRLSFIRKYARHIYGVEVDRDDARLILKSLFDFLTEFLRDTFDAEKYFIGSSERFHLSKDLWILYPHRDEDIVYRCDTCGCQSHLDTHGVCTTNKCEGHLIKMTYAEAKSKDRYYKDVYCEEALPIQIKEHTAQLSTERARFIQSNFIKGDVNILSCTTTFELGVDVGDLRAIFMRNVPPSTANYTQRAGRVGRRAGKPGYAITFCRLRPHDVAHFKNPRRIIAGETRVPFCYMENPQIAIRHVFAVALSEFFRYELAEKSRDCTSKYNSFMSLSDEHPQGLKELQSYLNGHPAAILDQMRTIFPSPNSVSAELGVFDWSWVEDLVSEEKGRLSNTHNLKRSDYVRVEEALSQTDDGNERSRLEKARGALQDEQTIQVLAETGVLPKYGFPTDIVELHLGELDHREKVERLQLQRGLRQAIREYAPGSEVVAGGELWRSIGIRRRKGHELITRAYGRCQNCGTFVWPIDVFKEEDVCPVCHRTVRLTKKMLIPSLGFEGEKVHKGIGLRKPRATGYTKTVFSQHSLQEVIPTKYSFAGGIVLARFSGNGQLCVINENKKLGFSICTYCGASSGAESEVRHTSYCKKHNPSPSYKYVNALGAAFVSDVLELVLSIDSMPTADSDLDRDGWESVMWAVFTAAAKLLEIPQPELGGTLYKNDLGSMSLLIYDDVPGGAGHAKQLSEMVEELLREAYRIVEHCSCSRDTCCYGCIGNYNNQSRQAKLSRGAAADILRALLLSDAEESNVRESVADEAKDASGILKLTAHFDGPSLETEGFSGACLYAKYRCANDGEVAFIDELARLGADFMLETPQLEVTFSSDDGKTADCMLAWEHAHVLILGQESLEEFTEAFGEFEGVSGWRVFRAEEDPPVDIVAALGGEMLCHE